MWRSPYSKYVGHSAPSKLGWVILCAVALFLLAAVLTGPATGCAALGLQKAQVAPGSEPAVVYGEQTLDDARAIFQEVTEFDSENRELLKQVAPQVHEAVQTVRRNFWPQYDTATSALRLYKRTRAPADATDANEKLASLQNYVRQLRLILIQSQSIVNQHLTTRPS